MANPSSHVGLVLCGRYHLTKLIGQGGMGSVYEARDRAMADRVVAVKVLAPHLVADQTQVTRFEQEARAANQLRHPNTISVLDFGHTDDGLLFMALEYLHGETLTQVMRHGPIDPARGLYMLRQVCKSLAEAHAKGIIHRDLKPDNIFVCEIYGESDFIKVIDFGIAKLAVGGAELTQVGKMFGTPRYLSPEQAQGLPLTATSDLYSLGVILFEMLTGQPPFHADDPMSIAVKHVQEPAPTLRDRAPQLQLPAELEAIVTRLLAKKPTRRFQTAEEVLAAVDACLHLLGAAARLTGPVAAVGPRTPTRPKTIPPIPAPRPVTAPPQPKSIAATDATRPVTVGDDATQMIGAMADDATDGEEATRAVAAMEDAPAAALRTPSAHVEARPGAEGRTLALEIAESPEGGVQARRAERAAPARRRTAPAPANRTPVPASEAVHAGPDKLILVAIAVVLAALGGGGAWWWRGAHDVPVAQPASAPPAPESEATRAPVVSSTIVAAPDPLPPANPAEAPPYALEIVSDPSGANLTVNGMPAGTTPVQLKLSASAKVLVAVLTLPDHEDYRLEIDSQKVREAGIARMPIHLVAKAQPKVAAPKPAPVKAAPHKPKIEW